MLMMLRSCSYGEFEGVCAMGKQTTGGRLEAAVRAIGECVTVFLM